MNLKVIVTSLCFFVMYHTFQSYSQQTVTVQKKDSIQKFSLKEALDYAIKNSYSIKNADIDIISAKKKIWETTAIGLPQITSKLTYQNSFTVPELNFGPAFYVGQGQSDLPITKGSDLNQFFHTQAPIPIGAKESTSIDFTLTQLIFSGAYIVGLQASRTYAMLSNQGKEKAIKDLKENVSNAYYGVLIIEENKRIVDSTLATLSVTSSEIEQFNKQGFVENTDVDQIKLTYKKLYTTSQTIENQINILYKLLKFQMGMNIDSNIVLTDNLSNYINTVNIETLAKPDSSYNVSNNINIKLIDTQVKLAILNLRRQQSEFLPTVALYFNRTEKFKKPVIDFQPKNVLGISVSLPLFTSGQRIVKVQQASLDLQKAQNMKKQAEQGLLIEIAQTKSDYNSNVKKYLNEKENLEIAKNIYNKTLFKYQKGVSASMELTQAQNQFLSTQSAYINALYDLVKSKNKLEKLLSAN